MPRAVTSSIRKSTQRRLLAGILSGTALPLAALSPVMPTPALAQAAQHDFDIPAQPLNRALRTLAEQSGLQLAYRSAVAAGTQAPALRGRMSTAQALARLLDGSGLDYSFTGANTVTITRAAAPAAGAVPEGSVLLDTVTLNAGAPGTTEGTQSYTTDVATGSTGLPLSLKQTPQSVTVVTRQRMQDQGLQTTQQVLGYTTGVNSATYETDRDTTWTRGQWVASYIIDGVLVDGG